MTENSDNSYGLESLADLIPYARSQQGAGGGLVAVCGDETLSWAELDQRTAQLAEVLRVNGIEHQDRVGIYLHKSIESLIAVHGVLRSGAAYVPLDPLAPASITAAILEDCEISVVITAAPAARRLSSVFEVVDFSLRRSAELLVIGAARSELGETSMPGAFEMATITWAEVGEYSPIPAQEIKPDGIAYIMYTSGSTGTPKGIVHTHRSGLAYATNAAELYGFGPDDCMASLSPLHFDMSLLEFFTGVLVGATIVIVPEPYLKLPASLSQLLADERCTTLYAVPSLFQQLLHRGGLQERDFSALRWVLHAGEVFPVEPLRSLFRLWPHARFSNIYGPAEVNQCSYFTFDTEEAIPVGSPLPIGKPWQNTAFKIVDENDQTVSDGEQGLLLVSTSTMMQRYWKRPKLDAEAFVELMDESGHRTRWYRTGDVVAARADGQLVFFGRRDNQTKVRGHRVELETVEDAVCGLPGIAQAVVGPQHLASGDTQLTAFYQPAGEPELGSASPENLTASEITDTWRQLLVDVLPGYAIPTAFYSVSTFPLTSSGKIDRRTVRKSIQQVVDE